MLPSFVADDPWFAGYSAVMVNLSDVAAMGGRPLAIVDVLWTPGLDQSGPDLGRHERGFKGLRRTHCRRAHDGDQERLPVSGGGGFGKGKTFDHQFRRAAGDDLLVAIDLRGSLASGKAVLERQRECAAPSVCGRI